MFSFKIIYIIEENEAIKEGGGSCSGKFSQFLLANLKDTLQANKVKYRNLETVFASFLSKLLQHLSHVFFQENILDGVLMQNH
jgi:hypothetical protein